MDGLQGLCQQPSPKPLDQLFIHTISPETVKKIPSLAYRIPDLDGTARMQITDGNGKMVACVEAPLSNGQTVDQSAIGWVTAVISGLALLTSAVVSGMGHSNTAAHIAANALSVFGYFQAQAMIAMVAVPLPPLVSAWAQNYDWAMGIIKFGFMQKIFHWYIQATGGVPASLFKQQEVVSVQIAKRSISPDPFLKSRAAAYGFTKNTDAPNLVTKLVRRSNNDALIHHTTLYRVTGIERMSYKAGIESTNFFLTGMSFFAAFVVLVFLLVSGFRVLCKSSMIKRKGSFREFRAKWLVVLKGIMYRVVLIGFPQMAILCSWEWIQKDSPAAVVLAAGFFVGIFITLAWASYKILTISQHSSSLDNGPAYTLYSDPAALNRWGYLYVQFRTGSYFYIVPSLVYILAKSFTLSFGQGSGTVQTILILVLDFAWLLAACIIRPWLDKRTNIVNIGIAVVNFFNSTFVFVFSGVTHAPPMVSGVLGVIFFIINAIFALVLLILILFSTVYVIFSKDPEGKYQAMRTSLPAVEKKEIGANAVRDLDEDPEGHGAPLRVSISKTSSAPVDRGYSSASRHSAAGFSPAGIPLPPSTPGSDIEKRSHYAPSMHSRPSTQGRQISFPHPYTGPYHATPPPQQQQPINMNWQVGAGYDR